MTKREFWLKLFSENDTALASAIILCERFVADEQLENGKDYIETHKKELYEEIPEDKMLKIFPNYKPEKTRDPIDKILDFCKQEFEVMGVSSEHINFCVGDYVNGKEYVLTVKEVQEGHHWSEYT